MNRPAKPGTLHYFIMATTVKLKEKLTERLDLKQNELAFDTRTNLVEVVIRKGLDFLDEFGYDALLKIPSRGNNEMVKTSK